MTITYTYKLQGDGSDSWTAKEFDENSNMISSYMVYHKPKGFYNTIEEAIIVKCEEIDINTQSLIFRGFEYASLTWSMSINAQINWSNLPLIPESFYPINLLSMSDDVYILTYVERMNFYLTAAGFKNNILQSGSMLKMQIQAKTNVDEVVKFIDARI